MNLYNQCDKEEQDFAELFIPDETEARRRPADAAATCTPASRPGKTPDDGEEPMMSKRATGARNSPDKTVELSKTEAQQEKTAKKKRHPTKDHKSLARKSPPQSIKEPQPRDSTYTKRKTKDPPSIAAAALLPEDENMKMSSTADYTADEKQAHLCAEPPPTWPPRTVPVSEVMPGAVAVAGFDAPISGDDLDDDTYIYGGDTIVNDENDVEALDARVVGAQEDEYGDHQDILERIQHLEDLDQDVIEAEVTPDTHPKPFYARRSTRVGVLCLGLVFIVAIVVGVVVGGQANDNLGVSDPSPAPSMIPSASPSLAPTTEDFTTLYNYIAQASLDGGAALSDPASPQYAAVKWLYGNANLAEYSDAQRLQRYVLATLYYSTGGEEWTQRDGWLSDAEECTWYTVFPPFCLTDFTTERVANLDLSTNNLIGTIPALELALLSDSLFALHLNGNGLTGTLPSEIGLLTKLTNSVNYGLNLFSNSLEGTLPTELGQLTGLGVTDLASNLLSGPIASEIGSLSLLTWLNLNNNKLNDTLPSQLYGLTNLGTLDLGFNSLVGTINSNIGLLSNLVELNLDQNQLRGTVPTDIGLLLKLESLFLDTNSLTGTVPRELLELPVLTELWLYSNMLSGPLTCPASLEDCRISCSSSTSEACRNLE